MITNYFKENLIALPPPVEEIATLWAKILHKKQAKDEKAQENFFIDFKAAIDKHMPVSRSSFINS